MSQRLLAFALGAALISIGSADPVGCGAYEVSKCGPLVEATCDNVYSQSKQSDASCRDGCFCRDGYVRDDQWKCVPLESCQDCPANATWSSTGGIIRTCQRPRGIPSTESGCFCNKDYLKDTSAIGNPCVFWKDCSCPGENQYYHDQVPQYPKTCNHHSNSTNHDIYLEDWKACICQEDYVLYKNECIPVEECPITPCQERCARKGEKYVECARDINCNTTYTATDCKKGCQCHEGFARDSSGTCIPLDQCPCMGNATFALGVSACPETCSRQGGMRCMAMLQAGCACDEGYVLTDGRNCIKKEDCAPSEDEKCKMEDPNKEYRTDQSSSCIFTCDNLNPVACTDDSVTGCFCKQPFIQVSFSNKTCIRPFECPEAPVPKECPETMEYTKLGRLFFCANKVSEYRQNDCVCPAGELYDEIAKKCVDPSDCKYAAQEEDCFKSDPNKQYYQCSSTLCPPSCEKIYPDYCKRKCTAGCYCKDGLLQVSDNNTDCVLPSDCPTFDCGPHATLTNRCTVSKRCDNMYLDFNQTYCDGVGRCICDDGYVTNSNGECVLPEECTEEEIVCPQNMVYGTCHGCPRHCGQTDRVCTAMCRIGCGCMENYVLNKYNVCVPETDCSKECPDKEVYKKCKDLNPDTCKNLLVQYKPMKKEKCVAGCDCQENFVRNSNGTCVDPLECMPFEYECGPNMVYTGKPAQCDICQTSSPPSFVMVDGCDCNTNLVFDSATGMCVDQTMCTKSTENQECQANDPNSQYSICAACPRNCRDRHPLCNELCKAGCECKPSYVYDITGKYCIEETSCSPLDSQLCHGNTTYQECVTNQKCATIYNYTSIPTMCQPGCACLKGYLENSDGNCVLPNDDDCEINCEQQDPNSEFRKCETERRTCEDLIPISGTDCIMGCFCKEDFILDHSDGKCIEITDCKLPKDHKSGEKSKGRKDDTSKSSHREKRSGRTDIVGDNPPNQENDSTCSENTSNPDHGTKPRGDDGNNSGQGDRTRPGRDGDKNSGHGDETTPGCDGENNSGHGDGTTPGSDSSNNSRQDDRSKPGDDDNNGGKDSNESRSGTTSAGKRHCPINSTFRDTVNTCGRTCDTYYMRHLMLCPRPEDVPGCDCDDTYVRSRSGDCVLIEDCPATEIKCPENAHYEESVSPRTCRDYTSGNDKLKKGCFCNDGMVYTDDMICVRPTKCPFAENYQKCREDDYFSVFAECASSSNITCDNPNGPILKDCRQRCVCRDGYIYQSKDFLRCIPKSDCGICCAANETYSIYTCSPSCSNHHFNMLYRCLPRWGCACKPGYVHNSQKQCISVEDCTREETVCPSDQEYVYNGYRKTCTQPDGGIVQTSGCFCKDGLLLNEVRKTCMTAVQCANAQCEAQDCNSEFSTNICEKTCEAPNAVAACESGCICKDGYVRRDSRCISVAECHNCGANAVYQEAVSPCEPTCANYYTQDKKCPKIKSRPGCACYPGYVRNKNGECVIIDDCSNDDVVCPMDAAYEISEKPKTCKDVISSTSKKQGCFCKNSKVFDSNNKCVAPESCPFYTDYLKCKKKDHMHYGVNVGYEKTCMGGKYYFVPFNGCVCDEGYVADENDRCIPEDDCPNLDDQKCKEQDPNSYYTPNVCERNCSIQNPPTNCNASCICQYGYARIDQTCIPLEDCNDCGPYATYRPYVNNCGRRCQTYRMGPIFCATLSQPGCDCNDNAVRNAAEQCIPFDQCPENEVGCPNGTHFENCSRPRTCNDMTVKNDKHTKDCFCVEPMVYHQPTRKCVMPEDCPNDNRS